MSGASRTAFLAGVVLALSTSATGACAPADDGTASDDTAAGPCVPESCNDECIGSGWAGGVCTRGGWECSCQEDPGTCDPAACNDECVGAGWGSGVCVDSGYTCDCRPAGADADADADAPRDEAGAGDADGDDDRASPPDADAGPYDCGPTGTITRSVVADGATRTYWLYVPTDCDEIRPIAVLFAWHGSGDSAENYIRLWTRTAEREGFLVVAQEGVDRMSWGPDDGPTLDAIFDDVSAAYDADERRFYATGFSAGAHFSYILGLYNSERFAAIAAQSGSMSYVLADPGWADAVTNKLPVDIHHGRSDPVVPFSHAEQARDVLTANGHTVYFHPFDGGHTTSPEHADEIWAEIGSARLP